MKVFISADMEGVAGIVHSEHTSRNGKEHDYARMLMTEEVNAAVTGALAAGAKEIVINDSHGTMRNIYPDKLRSEATLIMGSPKKLGMMEGISTSFDAALFVGYHTKMGAHGILNHTYSGRTIRSISINGKEFGEFGINALLAGEYQVPVVFVSGCNLLSKEAKGHIPEITCAEVKRTINRVTAENCHPRESCKRIEAGVKEALQNRNIIDYYRLDNNAGFQFKVSFLNSGMADVAEILPIVERADPLSVRFSSDNAVDGYRIVKSLIMMAANIG